MRRSGRNPCLKEMVADLVAFGEREGADEIEISIIDGSDFGVDVRLGQIESLVEAKSRYLTLRAIKDKKTAFATSSDLSRETLEYIIKNAIKRASFASPDLCSGLPPLSKKVRDVSALNLYDPEISTLPVEKKISLASLTEKIALSEKRITNSHGASFEAKEIKTVLANSNGFLRDYKETYCSLSVGLQAGETDARAEDYWFSTKRHFQDLDPPEAIAKKAVERTLRQLNPKKIKTQSVPIILEPLMTSWLLGFLFVCISGVSIYQKASFLVDRLGDKIGSEMINVYDDGLLPGKLGTRPFDAEGLPTQKTPVLEKGILKNYLCNTYAARKLKLRSTANSDGVGVSPNNFYLQAGDAVPEEIIRSTEKGLILIRTIGHGLNPVTGDISRGAFGLWVERGEILHPVSEITISGNLGEFLESVEAIGNDLEFRSAFSGPTVKIGEAMISGE